MRQQRRILAYVLSCISGFLGATLMAQTQLPQIDMAIKQPSPLVTIAEQYLLRNINAERASLGLPAVKADPGLQAAARNHAMEMARTATLSHRLPGEPDLSTRGSMAGASFSRISENVATGPSVVVMHDALMQSPHHRDNILDGQVDSIGISVVQVADSLWAVEDFSRSVEHLSLDEQEAKVSDLLRNLQMEAAPTAEARVTCGLTNGYVGARPALTMRYTTGDLSQLPQQFRARVQGIAARSAAVGACGSQKSGNAFASYNIAIVLYR